MYAWGFHPLLCNLSCIFYKDKHDKYKMDREKENGEGWRVSRYEPHFARWQESIGFLDRVSRINIDNNNNNNNNNNNSNNNNNRL